MSAQVKIPPHANLAEQSVIGGLLLDNSAWLQVQGLLKEADFYSRQHQYIFRAIRRLADESKPVDVLTVSNYLEEKKVLDESGGLHYLGMLANDTPSAANIVSYAEIVRDRSLRRQLIGLARQISDGAFDDAEQDADGLLQSAENLIFKLRQQQTRGRGGFVRLKEALKSVLDTIEENFNNPPETGLVGVPSGFKEIDDILSGFNTGLYIIAGRPAMGKTSFVMNIAESAACSGIPVAVFSLEMPTEQLAQRMLAGSSGLPIRLMRQSWKIRDEGWPKLTAGLNRIAELPMWIDDTGGQSVTTIRALCMRLNADIRIDYPGGIGMIVIDYLQLMLADDERRISNQNDRISQISRDLKLLSKEFNVPVLVLSQLNREVEKRGNKRPMCADLRDSGAIEQDADVIMFVYRDEVYEPNTQDKGVAEIIVGKQRNGPLGTVRLLFEDYSTRFRSFI